MGTAYEGMLWLVGGAVRDQMLGLEDSNDLDIVLEGDAPELARFLHEKGVSSIGPVVYPRFGTALVRVAGANVELATARKESYGAQSRKPSVEPASLREDALRRDFTVNALLKNVHSGELFDPLGGGLKDLENRVLRTPLEPLKTFQDDPLRILRAIRFRRQLGFEPAAGLLDAVRDSRERLRIISMERVRDELVKMLAIESADLCMADLMDLDVMPVFAPELAEMKGVEGGKYHHLDVWGHTLAVLRNVGPGDLTLSLAALLHDVGKPQTRFVDERGDTRFFGHEAVGAELARQMLRRLKFSNEQIDPVVRLVRSHMRLGSSPQFSASAARRVLRDLGEDVPRLLALVEADTKGLKKGLKLLDLAPIRRRLEEVSRATPRAALESPLSGEEIMQVAGIGAGPKVGELKQMLIEHVLDGTLEPGDKEGAQVLLRSAIATGDTGPSRGA